MGLTVFSNSLENVLGRDRFPQLPFSIYSQHPFLVVGVNHLKDGMADNLVGSFIPENLDHHRVHVAVDIPLDHV